MRTAATSRKTRRGGVWVKIKPGAGAFLIERRGERSLSQRELAELCGCSRTTIYMIETESFRLPTLSYELAEKICKYLGLKVTTIFIPSIPNEGPTNPSKQQRRGSASRAAA